MAVSRIGGNLGASLGEMGAAQDPLLYSESFTEKTTAPKTGEARKLSRGPLVEGNLVLLGEGGRLMRPAEDYLEEPDGGFVNLRMTAGTVLTAEYFHHAVAPVDEGGSFVSESFTGGTSAGPRFATLWKMGAI